jgi:acyl dehydratase
MARTLDRSPRIVPLYARAAATLVPGAGRLPFLPGGSASEVPTDLELELAGVAIDAAHLAAYARVCGFALRDELPATYLHVVAFPLHLALMADRRFPFGAVGLVHMANTVAHVRPVRLGERVAMHVRPTALEPHPRGRTFTIVSHARVGDEVVWRETSTFLRREAGGDGGGQVPRDAPARPLPARAEWRLAGDLGRRYAAVSGDRNPIHLHDLGAKLLGFPRTIAHGMWTQARCLAALERSLPAAYTVTARFRRPVLLPSRVTFGRAEEADGAIRFAVHAARDGTPHLEGRVTPGATARPGPG